MIRAIIIDDEQHCRKTLMLLLKEYCPDVQVVDQCSDAESGIKAIQKFKPDLTFLDIEMPRMNGFEMLEHFSEISFSIVFTTGYDQYAIKAFRFYAIDYLLKPVESKELIAAVQRVKARTQLPTAEQFQMLFNKINSQGEIFPKIPVPTSDGFEFIPVDQILFCEAHDNYTFLNLKAKKKIIACRMLKDVEEQLSEFPNFVRIHHSYIININEVKKYIRGEGGYVLMSDDTSVNVSRSRKEALLKMFKT